MRPLSSLAAHAASDSNPRSGAALRQPVVRIGVATLALTIVVLAARQGSSEAAPQVSPSGPVSILPANVGVGIPTSDPVRIDFAQPMNITSVTTALQVYPQARTRLSWSTDARQLTIAPVGRWHNDERYVLVFPANAQLANGSVLGTAMRYSFTTGTAPRVTEFSIHRNAQGAASNWAALDPDVAADATRAPADTAEGASASTTISIAFSSTMNRADVERSFLITPHVAGELRWDGSTLTFVPAERLEPGTRYAIAFIGAHDADGNQLAGDISFSFTIGSRAAVVRVTPGNGATGVTPQAVQVWFSGAVDPGATGGAFRLVDTNVNQPVAGTLAWSADQTLLTYTPRAALASGHRFEIRLLDGAHDSDGNPLTGTYAFTTKAASARRTVSPVYPAPSASGSVQAYALALINTSRRAFGFAPLSLDARVSAVAAAHAWDQVRYGYFSHVSRDGSTFRDRLTAAGISYSHAGENQCEDYGSITHAISWCHSIMMAEPYPGVWNHIANILNPNFTRVGFGYGSASDGEQIMTWDFIG